MDTQLVKLEILEPHVGIVTIDNPSVNAYSTQVLDEIALVFDVISDRDDIRVAILTGAGKVFLRRRGHQGAHSSRVAQWRLLAAQPLRARGLSQHRGMPEARHSGAEWRGTGRRPGAGGILRHTAGGAGADASGAGPRAIAGKSPIAIKLVKHALNQIEGMTLRDGYRFEQTMTGELSQTADSTEAMRAFVEKRDPVFIAG